MTATATDFLRTPRCGQLGIELPIIPAGMGPIAGPELVVGPPKPVGRGGGTGSLLTEVLPAATVVAQMAAEATARLTAR